MIFMYIAQQVIYLILSKPSNLTTNICVYMAGFSCQVDFWHVYFVSKSNYQPLWQKEFELCPEAMFPNAPSLLFDTPRESIGKNLVISKIFKA